MKEKELMEEPHRKKLREEIDARIASQTEAELATLRKAEAMHQRVGFLIAEEKGKISDLRVAGESIICQLKTAPPDEIMPLSKRRVKLDREIEEVGEGIKNLNNMLPTAEETLKKAKMAHRVKVLITARDWRDCCAGAVQDMLREIQLEPLLAAYKAVAESIISEYGLSGIQGQYQGGDIQNIRLISPLLFDVFKDGDPSYKHWVSTRHPLQNLTPEQLIMATKKSGVGLEKI